MKIYRIVLVLIITLTITSCNKPVYKYNSDFEGTWRTIPEYDSLLQYTSVSEIIIDGPDGSYKNSCSTCGDDLCNCISFQSGKAVMNDDKTRMRFGSNSYGVIINEEPNVDSNGAWKMIIEGRTYHRQ